MRGRRRLTISSSRSRENWASEGVSSRSRRLSFARLPSGRLKSSLGSKDVVGSLPMGQGRKVPWRGPSGGLARRTDLDLRVQHDDVCERSQAARRSYRRMRRRS